jgi:hypothetical protein
LRQLDVWLTQRGNRADPSDVIAEVEASQGNRPIAQLVNQPNWGSTKQQILDSLVAEIVLRRPPAVLAELTRLLLVAGLLDSLAATPRTLSTADEVEACLGRTLALPVQLTQIVQPVARLARRYGFSDLFVVRDEWNRYEPGEIAYIENVLAGETKKRVVSRLSESEATVSTETETTISEERDTQSTDRMELTQNAQNETDLAAHIDGKVDTDGQYGPTHVNSHIGGSFDYSRKDAQSTALALTHEAVARAVKRVEQRVKVTQTTRNLERFKERDTHSIVNSNGSNIVGIYRWVDKIQRLQLFRYPHRFLLEFQVPEPAAYLRWRRSQPPTDVASPNPVPLIRRRDDFTPLLDAQNNTQPLQPGDLSLNNYQWWVGQYNVIGVTPPPPATAFTSTVIELKQQASTSTATTIDESVRDTTMFDIASAGSSGGGGTQSSLTIPDGYQLVNWTASGLSSTSTVTDPTNVKVNIDPMLTVLVGDQAVSLNATPGSATTLGPMGWWALSYAGSAPSPPITGDIQVTVLGQCAREFRVHITLQCALQSAALAKWQLQTYEKIASAYWAMKRQYDEAKAAKSTSDGVQIQGDSGARNREVISVELKRGVIEMLAGQHFSGRDCLQQVPDGSPPRVAIDTAVAVSSEIQFIEQAFEWENMTYVLYPYYWAAESRWPSLADIGSADEEFARFLRSGSARVVVPARPGFEDQVRMYVDFGVLWGGGPVPSVNDPEYLSVAEEIKNQTTAPADGERRESWEVRLPTTLVWLDNDGTLPKVNPEPTLDAPPGP